MIQTFCALKFWNIGNMCIPYFILYSWFQALYPMEKMYSFLEKMFQIVVKNHAFIWTTTIFANMHKTHMIIYFFDFEIFAAIHIDKQPCCLQFWFSPKKTLLTVEEDFLFYLFSKQLILDKKYVQLFLIDISRFLFSMPLIFIITVLCAGQTSSIILKHLKIQQ